MAKSKYWNIQNILATNSRYNIVFGERSNGKTYGALQYGIERYFKDGSQIAIIRRWEEDFRNKNAQTMFDGLIANKVISKLSKGKYHGVKYQSHRWFFTRTVEHENGEDELIIDREPFAYAFALSSDEHYKSTSYPKIKTIVFDEFLTRNVYLQDEFVRFTSVLSTIIRLRDDVIIFMLGNTVNKFSPYFKEMGLKNIDKMQRGKIDVYTYGDTGLRVAVEYSDFPTKEKKSNVYFAFNNPKLNMIKDGSWEIDIYPHLPMKYKPKDIQYTYFIDFEDIILQCEIIRVEDYLFTYIHRKTTPIKDDETNIVYSTTTNVKSNYRRKITKPQSAIERNIVWFFNRDKVFYQDNDVGEVVRNYIIWCGGLPSIR